ncbi:D-2-hydroxyacid dehydrogenase [Halomonas mongoliensis]|uniref:D-2-hydroxyacid dehydrogenase n=1 Tax=Halomonas mongoliensis TaxID=321265 RepID=UPI00403B2CA1
MRLAIAFGAERYDYWEQRITQALADLVPELELADCSTTDALATFAPEVVVGHESQALIDYLRGRPAQLRWVQFMSAGLDRTLSSLGSEPVEFRITNMRGIHAAAMAEYLLAILLHFEKRLAEFADNKRRRVWSRSSLGQLAGKRLLVCGAGGIGQQVGEAAHHLGIRVEAVVRTPGPRAPFSCTHSLVELPNIIGEFDYVFSALPLTDATAAAFSRDTLDAMKPGAIFVNVGRGEMVDEAALFDALVSGRLGGAGLDVFSTEPLPEDSPLWDAPNLVITPHVSGRFDNGHDLGLEVLQRNMMAYLAGEPLATEVFPERGY